MLVGCFSLAALFYHDQSHPLSGGFLTHKTWHSPLHLPEWWLEGNNRIHLAVAQKPGTKMEPWQVETWTKTCVTPPVIFEPHPFPDFDNPSRDRQNDDPSQVITHAPGHMFVGDVRNDELRSWPVPGSWNARPTE